MLHSFNLFLSYFLSQAINRFLFALLSGFFLALTLPFIGLDFYIWFALVPLILLVKSSNSFRSVIFETCVFFFVYNLISFAWLVDLHPLTWQGFSLEESYAITGLAWLLPTIFHTLILLPFALILKLFYEFRTNNRSNELGALDIALISFVWVLIEHKILLNLGPELGALSVPINLLAYSQYKNQALIQSVSIFGAVGIEYFICFVNLVLSNFFNVHRLGSNSFNYSEMNIKQPFFGVQKVSENVKLLVGIFMAFVIIFIYGLFEINIENYYYKKNSKQLKTFTIIQPDFTAATTRGSGIDPDKSFELQQKLTSILRGEKQDILLWSEGSIPSLSKASYLKVLNGEFTRYTKVFAYGTYSQKQDRIYNSIEFRDYQKSKVKIHQYHKNHLVPFGEFTPFLNLFPETLQKLAGSTVGEGFSIAPITNKPISTQVGKISSCVCFELLFPKILMRQVLKGGNLMINLNDLSWFKGTSEIQDILSNWVKKEFLAVAVFRAVENRRDLILVGNSGYSGLISATGEIKYLSSANKIAVIQGKFKTRENLSLFTLYGW